MPDLETSRPFAIDGIVPIIPTPFTLEQKIAWEEVPDLIEFAFAAGACAVCLPAYASEFYKLAEAERYELVSKAVRHAAGRVPVIAQVNYPSATQAAEVAARFEQCGAAAICISVPRLFPLREADLFRYFDRVLKAIGVTLIIQDFNPGGSSISAEFIASLHRQYPHFRYVKLEEPMMSARVEAIRRQTEDRIGVIEGWGGMYILELVCAGICGVMPGLALTDLLALTFRLARNGKHEEAYEVFRGVLPQIVCSLQNLELFHHAEKLLLQARGVLRHAHVRDSGLELHPRDLEHIGFLNSRILGLLGSLGMPANPAVSSEAAE